MPKRFPTHGYCFVCGDENPKGIGASLWVDDDGNTVFTEIVFTREQQGPPGHVHGGAQAAVLDEVMGMSAWWNGYKVLSVHLEVDYKNPVPLGVKVRISGRVSTAEGDKVYTEGEIVLPDGTVASTGRGIYVNSPEAIQGFLEKLGMDAKAYSEMFRKLR